jgi:hypothetical protein
MIPEEGFNELLRNEIQNLTDNLPDPVLGAGPLSVLIFQPNPRGGRLVYLDKQVSDADPICLNPVQHFGKRFLDPDYMAPWNIAKGEVTAENIAFYCERNDAQARSRLALHDALRYQGVVFDKENGTSPIGTSYRVHQIIPAPLFQEPSMEGWKRLPRLGQIYSLNDLLDHENLLLMCALRVGTQVQHMRLKMILDHKEVLEQTAYEIAIAAATSGTVEDDAYTFLIAHLLLCHHWFFPFDPVALKIFAKLGRDPNSILATHGWPDSGLDVRRSDASTDVIELLIKDLAFLIIACAENVPSTEGSWARLRSKLRENLPTALSLVCGRAVYASLNGTLLTFRENRPETPRHLCIEPIDLSILFNKEAHPLLPMFSYAQVLRPDSDSRKNKTHAALQDLQSSAEAYVATLSPVEAVGIKDWNILRVTRLRGNKAIDKNQKMGKWVTAYARGRCALKILDHMKGTKSAA